MAVGLQNRAAASLALDGSSPDSVDGEATSLRVTEAGFRAFYEVTSRPLFAYLLRVSGRHDLAEDVLQEAYCRFLTADLREMDAAQSKSYLFRIASNLLRDHWRRSRNETVLDVFPEAETPVMQAESRLHLREAFQQLRPRERQLLWLAYVEGSSHNEIAASTGLRSGSIRLLLYRARRRLANLIRTGVSRNAKEEHSESPEL